MNHECTPPPPGTVPGYAFTSEVIMSVTRPPRSSDHFRLHTEHFTEDTHRIGGALEAGGERTALLLFNVNDSTLHGLWQAISAPQVPAQGDDTRPVIHFAVSLGEEGARVRAW